MLLSNCSQLTCGLCWILPDRPPYPNLPLWLPSQSPTTLQKVQSPEHSHVCWPPNTTSELMCKKNTDVHSPLPTDSSFVLLLWPSYKCWWCHLSKFDNNRNDNPAAPASTHFYYLSHLRQTAEEFCLETVIRFSEFPVPRENGRLPWRYWRNDTHLETFPDSRLRVGFLAQSISDPNVKYVDVFTNSLTVPTTITAQGCRTALQKQAKMSCFLVPPPPPPPPSSSNLFIPHHNFVKK